MTETEPACQRDQDLAHLRRTIALADASVANGNHPFGALLVDADGTVLFEAENTHRTDGGPGHAEANVARAAARAHSADRLKRTTLYTSVEPCTMCAGTAYWAGIGTVVFGMTEARLADLTGADAENPTQALPCRTVFAAGQRAVTVRGPFAELEDLIMAQHAAFWTR